jgi:hypothetical protein
MRKGKFAYARKSVPMPIKETFQMPERLSEHTPTPTEDEEEEEDDHDSSIQFMEHQPETPPHVLLSDDDTLSLTTFLNAVMENDAIGDGPVHNDPHGHGKEVMMEAPKKKKKFSKKDLRKME